MPKITDFTKAAIKKDFFKYVSILKIAEKHGVSRQTVSNHCRGWKLDREIEVLYKLLNAIRSVQDKSQIIQDNLEIVIQSELLSKVCKKMELDRSRFYRLDKATKR